MNAFIGNSPVQVMRAIQVKMTFEEFSDPADIFIGSFFAGADKIADNLRNTGIFERVVLMDQKKIDSMNLFQIMLGNNIFSKEFKKNKYTKLIAFNVYDKKIGALFNMNKKNPGFEYHCMEDGPNIYEIPVYPDYGRFNPYRLIGIQKPFLHIKNWWTSCPEYIDVPKQFNADKKNLSSIDINNEVLVSTINKVFGYEADEDLDKADVLIMDESHYQDGIMVDDADFKLYKQIKERYLNSNIMVKMHPRTQLNRYEKDFKILKGTHIPWEVYVMNRAKVKSKDLIQISICCGTMLSDKLMFDYEGTKIFLAPLFKDKILLEDGVSRVDDSIIKKAMQIKKTFRTPENFVIVQNEKELFDVLDHKLSKV